MGEGEKDLDRKIKEFNKKEIDECIRKKSSSMI